jgi:hypothetical protein
MFRLPAGASGISFLRHCHDRSESRATPAVGVVQFAVFWSQPPRPSATPPDPGGESILYAWKIVRARSIESGPVQRVIGVMAPLLREEGWPKAGVVGNANRTTTRR